MKNKKVSIIMPAYNCERTIKQAIESVINQDYDNKELIIINDGSSDNTENEIKKIKSEKIKLYTIKNQGVSHARNYGIKHSSGEYLMFIDSDDEYTPHFIRKMVEILEHSNVDQVCSSYYTLNNNSKIIGKISYKNHIFSNSCDCIIQLQKNNLFNQVWNKIYKLKIIKKNKIYFEEKISIAEDEKFNLDYINHCNKIKVIEEPLYKYKITPNGLGFKFNPKSNKVKLQIVHQIEKIFEQHNYDKKYVFESYIIQYFSLISNIVDKRNKIPHQEKLAQIKKEIVYNKDCQEIMKLSKGKLNKKYTILANILITKNKYVIYLFGKIAWYYDKYYKRKFGGEIKC